MIIFEDIHVKGVVMDTCSYIRNLLISASNTAPRVIIKFLAHMYVLVQHPQPTKKTRSKPLHYSSFPIRNASDILIYNLFFHILGFFSFSSFLPDQSNPKKKLFLLYDMMMPHLTCMHMRRKKQKKKKKRKENRMTRRGEVEGEKGDL